MTIGTTSSIGRDYVIEVGACGGSATIITMRKAACLVACLLIAVALVGVGTVVIEHLLHPRDEAAFRAYLRTYGGSRGKIELPATKPLVAEGDRACNWLDDQPTALWRTSRGYRFPAVMSRYRHEVRAQPLAWGTTPPDHYSVATAAWAYLCPATWQLHKPHYVFSKPNPGD